MPYSYNVIVYRVVDGDTLDVDIDLGFSIWVREQRIRLNGIDAPETRTRNLNEKKWGYASKEFICEMIDNAEKVVIETQLDKTGKYGRILADLYCDGVNVCDALVKNRLAIPYTGGNRDENRKKYNIMELWNTDYDLWINE